jgi:hypothetical protein
MTRQQYKRQMNDLINKFGHDNPDIVYQNVSSFQDLQETNIAFLNGKIKRTPYHLAPIDKETIPLIDKLVKINKYGFLSTCGQPVEITRGKYIKKQWTDYFGNKCGNWFYDCQQKSYITGIMESDYVDKLISFLVTKPVYFYIEKYPEILIFTNFPSNKYNVTKTRSNKDKNKLSKTAWDYCTNIHIEPDDYELSSFDDYPQIDKIIKENCVSVNIAGYQYGEGSVEDYLIEFFESIE